MNLTLTQSLTQFMLWFAIASTMGSLSYATFFLTRGGARSGILFISSCAFSLIFLGSIAYFNFALIFYLSALLGALLQNMVKRALFTNRQNRASELWRAFQCIFYPLFIGNFLALVSYRWNVWGFFGYQFGLWATPPAISFFRWMFHVSQLRPGIDRHFHEGEEERPVS